MLVLSRRKGESLVIGDTVLTLLETRSGRVRLGVEARDDVNVTRSELGATSTRPRQAASLENPSAPSR